MNQRFPNRHTYVGASEAGAAIGVSKWETRHDLWMYKTLRWAKPDMTPDMKRGHDMEPYAIRLAKEIYGIEITDRQKEYQSDDGRIRAHVDGIIPDYECIEGVPPLYGVTGPGVSEVKCPRSGRVSRLVAEGPDQDMLCQVQVQMHLAGLQWARLIILDYDDRDVRCVDIAYDQLVAEEIIRRIYEFLAMVDEDREPPDDMPAPADFITPTVAEMQADDELGEAMANALRVKYLRDQYAEEYAIASGTVRLAMKDCTRLVAPGIGHATYPVAKGCTTIQGDKLLAWAQDLCRAVLDRQEAKAWTMAKRLHDDPGLFSKVGTPTRRLTLTAEKEGEADV